jgi:WD40 repeat protein
VLHILHGHAKPLSFVAWSPDDSLILTCGNDNKIKLWDTLSGKLRRTYDKHADPVTACAWFPDGRRFVSGGVDKCTFMWDIEGNELEQWAGARINDLAISSDGSQMVRTSDWLFP